MGYNPDCGERIPHDLDHDCKSPGELITREQEAARVIVELNERIADMETDAKGYEIQHKDFLGRAKLAEAKLALVKQRWAAWQKVRVMGICVGERFPRLPGAAPGAIIDALDEACQG